MRLKLIIAYKGAAYQGWQIQEKADNPPTVQGTLENAVKKITGRKIRIHASGRTDSGVHAFGQVAHMDLPELPGWQALDWRHSLNSQLPSDIRIISAQRADEKFHSRKDAISKTYIYKYWTETGFIPPEISDYAWNCGTLNIEAMRDCIPILLGEHDFRSFQNRGSIVESTVRNIFSIKLEELPQPEFYPGRSSFLCLSICANGFLKQMARNIAGLLWKAGRGKISSDMVRKIIQAKNREALNAPTAPAHGLCLARVEY